MFSRLNSRPNLQQISCASHYGVRARPDVMSQGAIESVARNNGKASITQLLQNSETQQSHKALSSSSCNAQGGLDKLEILSQSATEGTDRCNSLTGSSPHSTTILPSSEATSGSDDFDPTKPSPQISAISSDTSHQIGQAKSDHGNNGASSSFIDSKTAASLEPSETVAEPAVVADIQPGDDSPVHSIGEMKIYNQTQKKIPRLYEARWQVIGPDIFDRVQSRLGRGRFAVKLNKRKVPVIIELMSAGVTKECSMPAVLVVIPRHIKAMQDFLNTDSTVQDRCKPEDGTTVELLALACKGSSTLIGMPNDPVRNDMDSQSDSDSELLSDSNDSLRFAEDVDSDPELQTLTASRLPAVDPQSVSVIHEPTYIYGTARHGMGIRLITKDGSQCIRGTCGGLFHLVDPNQSPRQVGMMAGHLLEQMGQDSKENSPETTGNSLVIGDVVHPKSPGGLPRYDWALFDATKLDFGHDTTSDNSVIVAQGSDFPETGAVVVVRTLRGEMTGTLSSSTSGIMLNADQGFVHVRTIVMKKDSMLTKGDSGAWVFRYKYVYGYIIATNGNDHAYMVPMHAAITEIQNTLGPVIVSLAISGNPAPQVRPGVAHEHFAQTPPSVVFSDTDSQISSIFSLPKASKRLPSSGAISSPPPSVTSLLERLTQHDQSRLGNEDRLAKAFLREGRVVEAIKIFESVMQTRENTLGSDHTDYLASQHELAVAYIQSGQTTEAIRLLSYVVKREAVTLHKEDIGRLTSQHELARAYLADGQASEAIKLLEDVVAVKVSTLHSSDPHLLASQILLAEAYLGANRASDAVKILEYVVAVARASSSELEEIIASSLGWLDLARKQLERAGMDAEQLSAQHSKPTSVFIQPREYA